MGSNMCMRTDPHALEPVDQPEPIQQHQLYNDIMSYLKGHPAQDDLFSIKNCEIFDILEEITPRNSFI
ncbi:hypothetical protein SS50377_20486 [Spironucleus salmonicida]|uniref:Uncharacterized protein n=1 Tax=Spironucleus salmonicida TaxID=348837 RepID=A0A9P8LZF9_9EUKA|nr:hypothetical protein SS50377_20483 [Spironucleus salmonicida]KAH0577135.1 hypothetical protein SS50377_20486 [Spironucleus salmonicida]